VTLHATRGPSFVMPPDSGFRPGEANNSGAEPTAEELAAVVLRMADAQETSGENNEGGASVCFAGLGEPLLRQATILETVHRVQSSLAGGGRPGVSFRVNTNGLFDSSVASALADAGIQKATVALASADEDQFNLLMRPIRMPDEQQPRGLRDVLAFISRLRKCNIAVEVGIVAHPIVDVDAARRLAQSVGANDVRVRTYFP
jgi:pyruvate-formate lyase-activating enzyme